ncbi:hypothetical protein MPLDJ20_220036 [Mesorhizobium plurifarium]|uniref:Uncharacterized protein n=1 Tax=Mesorhizobium plurifarium TaxID=69974 RepID=A0A090F953_MESPL|nr:hypothetical protein MPLDJ20_220036 [Mesorhizobium plurifarium]
MVTYAFVPIKLGGKPESGGKIDPQFPLRWTADCNNTWLHLSPFLHPTLKYVAPSHFSARRKLVKL